MGMLGRGPKNGNFRKYAKNLGILEKMQTIWQYTKVGLQYGHFRKYADNTRIVGSVQT
jgi:hypothetical protein